MAVLNKSTNQPIRVASAIHRALKTLAAHTGVSMSSLAGQAIQAMLSRVGK
jgi:predicted HicB family RNase H-like nuclease